MIRLSWHRFWLAAAVCATFVSATGCSAIDAARKRAARGAPKAVPAVPARPLAPPMIAQVAYGSAARFAVCSPPACPRVTRKTVAVRPPVVAAAPVVSAEAMVTSLAPVGPRMKSPCAQASQAAGAHVATRIARMKRGADAAFDPCESAGVGYIYFANNDDQLDLKARQFLGAFARRAALATAVVITGYTDSVGNNAANMRLATRRAAAVRDYLELISPGIADKATVHAKGDCCFVAGNDSDAGREMNRRVEIENFPVEGDVAGPRMAPRPAVGASSRRPRSDSQR